MQRNQLPGSPTTTSPPWLLPLYEPTGGKGDHNLNLMTLGKQTKIHNKDKSHNLESPDRTEWEISTPFHASLPPTLYGSSVAEYTALHRQAHMDLLSRHILTPRNQNSKRSTTNDNSFLKPPPEVSALPNSRWWIGQPPSSGSFLLQE